MHYSINLLLDDSHHHFSWLAAFYRQYWLYWTVSLKSINWFQRFAKCLKTILDRCPEIAFMANDFAW